MTDGPVRTVFLGSGAFGRESLWRLDSHKDVHLIGVVTAPPRPSGRGGREEPTVIHEVAAELAVPVILTPQRLASPGAVADVLAMEPDLIVLADYGQLVPRPLLSVPLGALNLHPSLLPRHRGATPIPAAILAGDTETGVTLLQMDEGLDTGPILAQTTVPLDGNETTPILEGRLTLVADALIDANLGPWIRGEIEARPQPDVGATMTRPLRREDGRLDPSRSAGELDRQIRAYEPWPGSFMDTPFGRLIVWSSAPESNSNAPAQGVFDERGLGVGNRERLWLNEVQPAGGKRMSWEAYVRGRPSIVGASIIG